MTYAESTIYAHRKKWLDALESGDYKRVSGMLAKARKKDEQVTAFCCLGVACDVAGEKVVPVQIQSNTVHGGPTRALFGIERTDGHLPDEAMAWLGVSDPDPVVNFPKGHPRYGQSCAELNDEARWTFKQIAQAIRKYGFTTESDLLKQARENK